MIDSLYFILLYLFWIVEGVARLLGLYFIFLYVFWIVE